MSFKIKLESTKIDQQNELGRCYKLSPMSPNGYDCELLIDFAIIEKYVKSNLFFKTPAKKYDSDDVALELEMDNELKNRDAIERAFERLKKSTKKEDQYQFNIKKLIGLANLQRQGETMKGLVYEFSEGKSISDNDFNRLRFKKDDSASFLKFAKSFATAIQKLHNQNVVHSYLVPRNIRVCENKTQQKFDIVGFGYAKLASSAGRKKLASGESHQFPPEDQLFLAPECKSASSFGGFWFPADIYSIGAILYAVLCYQNEDDSDEIPNRIASVLKSPPRDVLRLKKLIHQNLESSSKTIINKNENIAKIIDHCLRYRQEDRFSSIEELLESIDIAQDAESGGKGQKLLVDNSKNVRFPIQKSYFEYLIESFSKDKYILSKSILKPVKNNKSMGDSKKSSHTEDSDYSNNLFLRHMVDDGVQEFMQDCSKMRLGHLEVYGNRHKIITSLCRMLCAAKEGSEYNTTTIPHYWLDSNLGSVGRFLTMNKHMARKGVRIRRIFLVDEKHFLLLDPEEQAMLLEHLGAEENIKKYNKSNENNLGIFEVRVNPVASETINTFESEGTPVAHLLTKEYNKKPAESLLLNQLVLNFYSSTSSDWFYGKQYVSRKITKVRYWAPNSVGKLSETKKKFESDWNCSTPLKDFIERGYATNPSDRESIVPEKISLETLLSPHGSH